MLDRVNVSLAPSRKSGELLWCSGILLTSLIVAPLHQTLPSLCLVKRVLGIPCPGCGMTRAFLYLGHGDLRRALELNINSLFVFACVTVLWLRSLVRAVARRDLTVVLKRREVYCIVLLGGLVCVAGWVYNIAFNPWL